MNVLVIAAHPDDEALGPGATLRKHADAGDQVSLCVLCGQADARKFRPETEELEADHREAKRILGISGETLRSNFPNIRMNAVPHLELVQAIEKAISTVRPEVIYVHHPGDLNVDHRATFEATAAAIRLPQRGPTDLPPTQIREVLCYETLSSTEWAPPSADAAFVPNAFVQISEGQLDAKLRALAAYRGVMRPPPHPRSEPTIRALATLRGSQAGCLMAEAFWVMRSLR